MKQCWEQKPETRPTFKGDLLLPGYYGATYTVILKSSKMSTEVYTPASEMR